MCSRPARKIRRTSTATSSASTQLVQGAGDPYTAGSLHATDASCFDGLTDPGTVNAGRPTVLTLDASNWQDPKQAYLIQKGPLAFASTYDRVGGGTTRHWLGTSLRFVPNDFTMKTTYGREIDWPFGYSTLEPWYGKAEWEIGVSANKADQDYLGITFGANYNYPMPGIPMSMVDDAVSSGVNGLTIDSISLSVSPTPQGRNSQPYQSRRVCAGNTNCIPICPIQAKYDASVTMNDALQTGNVQVRYRSVANNIVVGANGRISQIDYITYERGQGPAHRHRQRHRQGVHHGGARDRDTEAVADVDERRPHVEGRRELKRAGRQET